LVVSSIARPSIVKPVDETIYPTDLTARELARLARVVVRTPARARSARQTIGLVKLLTSGLLQAP
jgi:hypothetical protein